MHDLTVYTAYHVSGPHPTQAPGYQAICNVGPDGARPPGFDRYDDAHGRPDRNQAYCELSAFSALLAEADTAWLGLVHYRRLFTADAAIGEPDRYPGFRRLREFDWNRLDAYGASADQLLAAVQGVAWASSPRLDVRRLGFESLLDQYRRTHGLDQIEVADRLLAGGGSPSLSQYLEGQTSLRPFNMMLARADLVREYASWLWPIIDGAYALLESDGNPYGRRWPGFLAERLLNYWLDVVQGGAVPERTLPLMLLHNAQLQNSAHPEQGRSAGTARPSSSVPIAQVLAWLPAAAVKPIAQLERRRSKRSAA